jgi:hypothetical protein
LPRFDDYLRSRRGPSETAQAFLYLAAAVLLGAAIAIFPLLASSRAYFRDDMQSEYAPIFVAVGRGLLKGQFTTLTLQMQNGGALLAEYQFGLLNPVSLASYAIASLAKDLPTASAILAVVHLTILCLGTYVLARAFKAGRGMSLAAATAFASNNFIFYWEATSWFPGLVSMAWFVWAAAFIARAHRGRLSWLGAVVFIYLTITSGWPHTVLALGLFAFVLTIVQWRHGARRQAIALLTSLVVGALIAAPSVLPVLGMSAASARPKGFLNTSEMVINLYTLAGVSSPFQLGQVKWEGQVIMLTSPIFYCAWFVVPLMPLLDLRVSFLRQRAVQALLFLIAAMVIATQGPDTVGTIHTPIRFVPFLHLFLLLFFAVAATAERPWKITPQRLWLSASLVIFGVFSSVQIQPGVWVNAVLGGMLVGCIIAAFVLVERSAPAAMAFVLVAGTLFVFGETRALIPVNRNLPAWTATAAYIHDANLDATPRSYSFLVAPFGAFLETPRDARFGAMRLMEGRATISGYSPIGLHSFADSLCVEVHGSVCAQAADRLLAASALGPPLADLLRIDEIGVYRGNSFTLSDQAQTELDRSWVVVADDGLFRTYTRRTPKNWPLGSVAWVTPGLEATSTSSRADSERIAISGATGAVVFARLAWPGYRAKFNGHPIPVTTREGFLLTVDVPPSPGGGTLVVTYEPPLMRPALLVCGIGLFGLLLGFALWPRVLGTRSQEPSLRVDATGAWG